MIRHLYICLLIAKAFSKTVLVLGSSGLVGRALVQHLIKSHHSVVEVKHRYDFDLRKTGSLSHLDRSQIDFCFFLACEVGGSKFLGSSEAQHSIAASNKKIYRNVFPFLKRKRIPYLFASSQLATTSSVYGRMKLQGERLTQSSGHGKVFRFWNVYGVESIGPKSHVLADWVYKCVSKGQVHSQTNGLERRQFTHTADVAVALTAMMEAFDTLADLTDVTSGKWVTMRELAAEIKGVVPCQFHFSSSAAQFEGGLEPSRPWTVHSPLSRRLDELVRHYASVERKRHNPHPTAVYISIIVPGVGRSSLPQDRTSYSDFLLALSNLTSAIVLDLELVVVETQQPSTLVRRAFQKPIARDVSDSISNSRITKATRQTTVTVSSPRALQLNEVLTIGAQHSRGRFLLFTSTTVGLPLSVAAWLAKEQLAEGTTYNYNMQGNCEQCEEGRNGWVLSRNTIIHQETYGSTRTFDASSCLQTQCAPPAHHGTTRSVFAGGLNEKIVDIALLA